MKLTATLSCLLFAAAGVLAAPTALEKRTSYIGGTTSNDVLNKGAFEHRTSYADPIDRQFVDPCTDLTFIFARGSTERGVCTITP